MRIQDKSGSVAFVYDFARDGGLQGQILLNASEVIPTRAIIWNFRAEVETAFTSGGAPTMSFDVTGIVGGLAAATALGTFGANALKVGPPAAAGQISLSELQIFMTIAVADLTGGVLVGYVDYKFSSRNF